MRFDKCIINASSNMKVGFAPILDAEHWATRLGAPLGHPPMAQQGEAPAPPSSTVQW